MLDPDTTLLRLKSALKINQILFETEEFNGGLNGNFNCLYVYDHTGKTKLLDIHIANDALIGLCLRVNNLIDNRLIDYSCNNKNWTYNRVFNAIINLIAKLDKKITGENSMGKYRVSSVVLNNDGLTATATIEISPKILTGANADGLALTIRRDINSIGTTRSKNYVDYSKYSVSSGRVVDIGIKDVIFNPPATIVNWADGTKTVVKCQNNETFDPEKGLALCYMKKINGNQSNFNNIFKKWIPKTEERPILADWRDFLDASLGYVDCCPFVMSEVDAMMQYMSIREAARRANISPSTLYRIKNSKIKRISVSTMDKIWNCNLFGENSMRKYNVTHVNLNKE